ncbi:MAG: ribonuclease J, partial [bacterium]|nr:ribonuclease J [bacterium]
MKHSKASPDTVKIIPLGGLEEIGRNMTVIEHKDDILIMDMGLQFPEEDTPGIDYIIPNISCLEPKKRKIKGVIITHAHLDHIGAIPYLLEKLGNPTIYAAPLTRAILLKRQTDFPASPRLDIESVQENKIYEIGKFRVEFFKVNHNIPDAIGAVIDTPQGRIVNPAEFKFEYDRFGQPKNNIEKLRRIAKTGVLALMLDSTRAEDPGRSMPESQVEKTIEEIIRKSKGRIIFATFAS